MSAQENNSRESISPHVLYLLIASEGVTKSLSGFFNISCGRPVYQLFVTHQDNREMFGAMHTVFGQQGINISETRSRSLDGKVLTVCLLHQPPTEEVMSSLRNIHGVYSVK